MANWEYDPAFIKIFGQCLVTVYRGMHLVMTWNKEINQYVVQESATKKVVASGRYKGDCYAQLKTYQGNR